MIAMQYSFTLPADYDMTIIDRRIRDKGPMLDGFPGLIFKAYLSAKRDDHPLRNNANLYAPFYLWENTEAMNRFLCGPGFAKVSSDFGWPRVDIWSVWSADIYGNLINAKTATRSIEPIAPYANLEDIRTNEISRAKQDVAGRDALASVLAFDPNHWRFVRFQLWASTQKPESEGLQSYNVGHVSLP